ncbi:MAG: DUF1292 domain-containing protein [Christensenellaceae bacterium]|jgi:uncharacterized protein YrzB (UPF0473 family)|nr:DUF1292 domain-containing protein [Christensenellaceae bacterium]
MPQDPDSVVVLLDEDGKEVRFEHILTIEHQGAEYAMVVPEGSEDLVVLKIVPGPEGDDSYEGVEDEALLNALYEIYLEQVEFLDEEE